MDLDTGKVLWVVQDTPHDAWLACGPAWGTSENCPKDMGPDYDFGASPILRTLPEWPPAPDRGAEERHGMGARSGSEGRGGVEGADCPRSSRSEKLRLAERRTSKNAYFGVSSAGVAAVSLATGERKWLAPIKAAGPRLGDRRGVECDSGRGFWRRLRWNAARLFDQQR